MIDPIQYKVISNGREAFLKTKEEGDCLINKSKLFDKIDPVYLADLCPY